MKPIHILGFLLATLGVFIGAIAFLSPKEVVLTDSYAIKFPEFREIFFEDTVQYADISHITDIKVSDSIVEITHDTIVVGNDTTVVIDTVRANADSLRHTSYAIQYPDGDNTELYPFFETLSKLKESKELVRIIHYGDSQIEGGRISSVVRNNLQKTFGGSGPGFMPIFEENIFGYQLKAQHTGDWFKHTRYGVPDSLVIIRSSKWGALASICRFAPVLNDSVKLPKQIYQASATFRKKMQSQFPLNNKFTRIKIFSSNNTKPVFVELNQGAKTLSMATIDTSRALKITKFSINEFTDEGITLTFTGEDSPDIYGIALDDTAGIAVDNVPMRGSSGLEFRKISKSQLAEMYDILNVKLFILEFGVNVVPNVTDNYEYYERSFYNTIVRLKEIHPEAPVLVIGISDMARKNGDKFESYPNVELIRDAQKAACLKAGCAFWDMFEAMGGKNSMPSWVFANPPLAQKDFTHFNYDGSKIVAEMFFNAFMKEYNRYLKTVAQK